MSFQHAHCVSWLLFVFFASVCGGVTHRGSSDTHALWGTLGTSYAAHRAASRHLHPHLVGPGRCEFSLDLFCLLWLVLFFEFINIGYIFEFIKNDDGCYILTCRTPLEDMHPHREAGDRGMLLYGVDREAGGCKTSSRRLAAKISISSQTSPITRSSTP